MLILLMNCFIVHFLIFISASFLFLSCFLSFFLFFLFLFFFFFSRSNKPTGVNVALGGRGENVLDEADGLVLGDGHLDDALLVLEANLVVQERLQQRRGRAAGAVRLALVRADGVVAVHGALALVVEPADNVVHVVREEALGVQHRRQHLRNGRRAAIVRRREEEEQKKERIRRRKRKGGETKRKEINTKK